MDDSTEFPEDVVRYSTWSRHDKEKVGVGVEGEQYGDGEVCRHIALYSKDVHRDLRDITADGARQLAAALIEAADALDRINPGNSIQVQAAFDVPPGTQPAELELHDSMFSDGVKLQL